MNAPPALAVPRRWHADALLLVSCVVVALIAALRLGQDANWDLLNYHFYDAWAWLAGRTLDWDIAAAQLQTYHNPLADVPFYLLVAANGDPRVVTLWLSLPTAVAGYFFVKIAWSLFRDLAPGERVGATCAATAIGFTGAMGVGQLGSTTDEWLVTSFFMASLWLLLRAPATSQARATWTLLLAGLLMGVASGLKLTAATYAVGLFAALLSSRPLAPSSLRSAAIYSLGTAAGLAAALGPWSYTLWSHFGNPVFPYANQLFHSPWWDPRPVLPNRFGPHKASEWLALPFKLLAPPPGFVSEVPYVDARLPVVYGLAIVAAAGALVARVRGAKPAMPASFRTTSHQWKRVSVAFVASFIVWAALHSILRYTIPLEILSGVLIVGLLGYLLRLQDATAAIAFAAIVIVVTTVWSEWGRVRFGPAWFDMAVPDIEANALVLLTEDAPMAYVLPFLRPDARYVGMRNNLIVPGQRNRLAQTVAEVIRDHRGAIYALSFSAGQGDADLRAHDLARVSNGCTEIRTNMPTSPIELCRLRRLLPARENSMHYPPAPVPSASSAASSSGDPVATIPSETLAVAPAALAVTRR